MANANSSSVSIVKNSGEGSFVSTTNYGVGIGPLSVCAADFNNDGHPDLSAVNYVSGSVSVLTNEGDGTFATAVNFEVGGHPRCVVSADFNGDNKPDIASVGWDLDAVSVLLNITPCCFSTTGNVDCNVNDFADISDLTALIDNLFISLSPLCCEEEANTDGTGDVDISDLTALIDHLFISLNPTAMCP